MSARNRMHRSGIVRWLLIAIGVTLCAASPALSSPSVHRDGSGKPTIVLVHGAFADASSWTGVVRRLQARGYTVLAPANPLRGVASDAAYLKSVLATVSGPIVLVGHSYGGMVITNAATGNPNVKALVYVAAYAPDQGDSVASLETLAPGGMIGPTTLTIQPVPNPDGSVVPEAYITPALFPHIFAADLPPAVAKSMAISQRPAALSLLQEPSGPPAWKTIPSWYIVAGRDNAIGTAVERIMAQRIGAHTVEIEGASHVVMISHPAQTVAVILKAANATQ